MKKLVNEKLGDKIPKGCVKSIARENSSLCKDLYYQGFWELEWLSEIKDFKFLNILQKKQMSEGYKDALEVVRNYVVGKADIEQIDQNLFGWSYNSFK